jgi:Protein of unknown function (DUF4013)
MELSGGAARTPDTSVGDAFTWALRDPEWISKLILMGLIGIIPIVGSLQLLGWMLTTLDNLRAGHQVLPPAGFRYATRGLWLFLAGLIYGLVLLILFYGVMFLVLFGFIGTVPAASQSGAAHAAVPVAFFVVMFTTMSGVFALALVLDLFVPLVIVFTDRKGFPGAFDWAGFVHAIRTSPHECLAAGALALVAYLISGLGSYLCYVGILFTIPYSLAIVAWVVRWFELKARPGALPV